MTRSIRSFLYAQIVKIVDGDTVDVEFDLGFHLKFKQRVRLHGVNTPERGQLGYKEATEFLTKYLNNYCTLDLEQTTDKYGRYIAWIYVDAVLINYEIIKNGFGVPYMEEQ
jgi:micrococcal nuclease